MKQDIRELFKNDREDKGHQMKEGHKERFLERLEKELPKQEKPFYNLPNIAATILILISMGFFAYRQYTKGQTIKTTVVEKSNAVENVQRISLGNLSPDLKKLENYYVVSINLELSKLEVSKDNKAMVNSFMNRLGDLNTEYHILNSELNRIGPNDQTIAALIKNLQLRLQLLHKLKEKLNELKSSKNETIGTGTI